MLVSYPALFYYDNTENVPFFVSFPDIPGAGTQGNDISDALHMAADWLGIHMADDIENNRELPKPSDINSLSLEADNPYPGELNYDKDKSFTSMVVVDLNDYIDDKELIKKTLTIPKWSDKLGKDLKVNFSKTLIEAIVQKKLDAK